MFYFHTPYYGRDELFLRRGGARAGHRPAARLQARRPAGAQLAGRPLALSPATGRGARPPPRSRTSTASRSAAAPPTRAARTAATPPAPRSSRAQRLRPSARAGDGEVLVSAAGTGISRTVTRAVRRHLVGPEQRWVFDRRLTTGSPARVERTSLYLHVPFCRNCCPYCPYTKVAYDRRSSSPTRARRSPRSTGGPTPSGPPRSRASTWAAARRRSPWRAWLASCSRVRERFRADRRRLHRDQPRRRRRRTCRRSAHAGVALVSLGVQSFHARQPARPSAAATRRTSPSAALALLARGGFASVQRRHHVRAARADGRRT